MPRILEVNAAAKTVIGVVHLPPLPGAPGYTGDIAEIIDYATRAARVYEETGFDAIIVENYGDKPFKMRVVEPETLAALTVAVREVVRETSIPVGVNVLRNSGVEAYAIAYAAGASFIRVNSYCETRVTPEGLMGPIARDIENYRSRYPAEIKVLTDIDVKHSYQLGAYTGLNALQECITRGNPDAVIVTGQATGSAPPPGYVAAIAAASTKPVLVGSGVTPYNLRAYWRLAAGFIIGTYIEDGQGRKRFPSRKRAEKLMSIVKNLRSQG